MHLPGVSARPRNFVLSGLLGSLVLFTASPIIEAQGPTGAILGTVKDNSGAVVPGANVTATNQETGLRRVVSTGADGSYRISALPVGAYQVRVEHEGFQSQERSRLALTVAQEAVINFTLEVGAVEQTVSVTAEAPLVETTSGSLSSLVNEQRVQDLPLNGRNYINLTLLQPGVTQQKNIGQSAITAGTWFSTNGAPSRSNYFLLDGAPLNDVNGASAASVGGNTLGIEGIREWRMITNSFSSEYGMTMGSQMVMVSKSGSNDFHGAGFEYLRNSALDARNFFDRKSVATPRRLPSFTRNNFGATLGGPIRRDKAFFFLTYEGLRERLGVTSVTNTIPAAQRVDGVLVPQISSVVKPLLALYPLPNLGANLYTFASSQPTDDDHGQARVDLTFSERDQLFARGTIDQGSETQPQSFGPPFKLIRDGRVQFYTLSESHVFTPALLSTARFHFSRTNKLTNSPSGITGPQFSFVPGREIGSMTIGGLTTFGADNVSPFNMKQNVFTWSDDLWYSKGRHSLKFGFLLNHYQMHNFQSLQVRGSVTFPSVTAFLLAQPSTSTAIRPGSITDRNYHYNTVAFYTQDDFRVNSRVTVNVGLRYEFLTTPQEIKGHGSGLRDIQHDAAFTLGAPFANPSLRNFSPRFGFAWDLRGDGKTAVRGGFGLLYDVATFGGSLQAATVASPPFSSWVTLNPPAAFVPLPFPTGISAIRGVDYHVEQPHLLQYNVTLERQLPASMAFTLSYVGSRGLNLMQLKEGNPVIPTFLPDGREFYPIGAPRVNPNWATYELHTGASDSWYNALQFGLSKRLSSGVQFQSSYTWSRCIDETQGQLPNDNVSDSSFGQDPYHRSVDRGLCSFHVSHNWQFNLLYRLPIPSATGWRGALMGGWWTGTIVSAQTGLPFTPALSANRSRSGVNGGAAGVDRVNLIAGRSSARITSGQSSGCSGVPAGTKLGNPDHYYDACAFAIPAAGFLGNAGRNILIGPGLFTADFTIAKDTALKPLGEGRQLQFRADFFNILNRANFSEPGRLVFAGTADAQPPLGNAGLITQTATPSRQIQLALKLLF